MQQEAIPFDLSPKTFALTIFFLIAVVCAIRFVIQYAPTALAAVAKTYLVNQDGEIEPKNVDEPSKNEARDRFPSVASLYPKRIMGDEGNVLRTCGTRALLGPSLPKSQAPSDTC